MGYHGIGIVKYLPCTWGYNELRAWPTTIATILPETSLLSRASLHFDMTSGSGACTERWEARYSLGTALAIHPLTPQALDLVNHECHKGETTSTVLLPPTRPSL